MPALLTKLNEQESEELAKLQKFELLMGAPFAREKPIRAQGRKRRVRFESPYEEDTQGIQPTEPFQDDTPRTEEQLRVSDFVGEILSVLPERLQETFWRRHGEMMTQQEMGERDGVSRQAIQGRLKTLERTLIKELAGVIPAERVGTRGPAPRDVTAESEAAWVVLTELRDQELDGQPLGRISSSGGRAGRDTCRLSWLPPTP